MKEVIDFNTFIRSFRDKNEKSAKKFGKIPQQIAIKKEVVKEIYAEWLIPQNSVSEKIIMYVHGGGYVSGSCNDHRGIISKFASSAGVTNLLYDYRLAPENPFPAAIEDSLTIYKWILSYGYKPENVIIAGESAGGGL